MSNILEMQNEIAKPKPLEAYNWSTIISKNLKEKEYILEPLIREKDIIMIYAKTGLGKTLISTGIAWAISTATEFLGWKCNKAQKTLFIDGEMPLISIKERVQILTSDIENDNFRVLSHDTLNDNQLMPDLSTIDGQRNIEHLT